MAGFVMFLVEGISHAGGGMAGPGMGRRGFGDALAGGHRLGQSRCKTAAWGHTGARGHIGGLAGRVAGCRCGDRRVAP